MKDGPDIARLAALIGDPARANMLTALMDGRALTATELAACAGITAQTASGHLARMVEGGLLALRKQGRHRYFALAGPDVAAVLEALMGFAARNGQMRSRPGPRAADLRAARVCYNHLAGAAGVQIYDSLRLRGFLHPEATALRLSSKAEGFMAGLGLDLAPLRSNRAPLCRDCLDWSERRNHLAGRLGRALFALMQDRGWCQLCPGSRAVRFSVAGRLAFDAAFPV